MRRRTAILKCSSAIWAPERVVFGSDATGRSFTSQLAKVYGADITEDERDKILYGNAAALFAR